MNHTDQHGGSSPSPSFSSYATNTLSRTAARVSAELNRHHNDNNEDNNTADLDFAFGSTMTATDASPMAYPIFDRRLLTDQISSQPPRSSVSSDSSFEDEMEGISADTYCLWTPRTPTPASTPTRCTKSNSTGSVALKHRSWRLRDLLKRSKSDGRSEQMISTEAAKAEKIGKGKGKGKEMTTAATAAGRRKTYLPYKQDLVGLFPASGHGHGGLRVINFTPF
ncbi:hypothetical protein Droror1_Dr00014044 [Drosera rotundifolia]